VWRDLVKAYASQEDSRGLPRSIRCLWPPSGMEDLNAAFKWAIEKNRAKRENAGSSTTHMARGQRKRREAIAELSATRSVGVAQACWPVC